MSAQRLSQWLRLWWPALVWAAAIASFSTDAFSGEHTSHIILPLLHWLFPAALPETLELMHHLIRKAGHVSEYFVLSLLLWHSVRAGRSGWRPEWAVTVVAISAGWAALDELHQAFVPSRGAAMTDVLIDVCGAVTGQLLILAFHAIRSRRPVAAATQ